MNHHSACCRFLGSIPSRSALAECYEHLIVDAEHIGNVMRFCNHSCTPNLCSQTIFRVDAGCPSLYYHGLLADENIPAMQPLTWDYAMDSGLQGGTVQGSVVCLCGSANCRKWLR
jgi:hypothetical protein